MVIDKDEEFTFDLSDSWLYIFRTQVAFLCLNLSFEKIETLQAICNPGWAYNPADFFWNDAMGERHSFSVEDWLSISCHRWESISFLMVNLLSSGFIFLYFYGGTAVVRQAGTDEEAGI